MTKKSVDDDEEACCTFWALDTATIDRLNCAYLTAKLQNNRYSSWFSYTRSYFRVVNKKIRTISKSSPMLCRPTMYVIRHSHYSLHKPHILGQPSSTNCHGWRHMSLGQWRSQRGSLSLHRADSKNTHTHQTHRTAAVDVSNDNWTVNNTVKYNPIKSNSM